MQFIRGTNNIHLKHRGCVLTIGNFDGVHFGHQTLMFQLQKEGKKRNLPIMVILFEPQPREFFSEKKTAIRLTSLRQKIKHLRKFSADRILCIRFNKKFSSISAENFITDIIVKKLDVKFLIIGKDFRFGANRIGNVSLLKQAGIKYNFDVAIADTINNKDGYRISSTAIRKALTANDFKLMYNLLGYQFSVLGRVIHGKGLGNTIGFPTANVFLRNINLPIKGVFIVEIYDLMSYPIPGVANIGTSPTTKGIDVKLEVHLLKVNINLYNKYITVVFKKKIRNEKCFNSLDELKKQIEQDVILTKNFFKILY